MDRRNVACMGAASFIGAMLVVAATVPVHAGPLQKPVTIVASPEMPPTVRVPYGDLALTTHQGRRVLIHRVSLAVDQVCPLVDEDGFSYDVRGCMDFAWSGARLQISRAFKAAKSGSTLAMSIEISAAPAK